jgi:hypothetical protein
MTEAPVDTAIVREIRGRRTAFLSGRRLLLPDSYQAGALVAARDVLDGAGAPQPDRTRKTLVRTSLVGERGANALGALFRPLAPKARFFSAFAALAVANAGLAALVLTRTEIFTVPGGYAHLPLLYLGLVAILLWHEIGHCATARRLGIRVDGIGAGVYLIFPALFSKVSLVTLLSRRERMIVYAGGLYFQLVAGVALGLLNLLHDDLLLRHLLLANITTMLLNVVPVLHLDGYRLLHEALDCAPDPRLRRFVDAGCTVLTVVIVGYFGYVLGQRLLTIGAVAVRQPTPGHVASAVLAGLFLLLLLLSAPRWLRRPRG